MKGLLKGVAVFGLLAVLGATSAYAQSGIAVGIGGGVSIPTGSPLSDDVKTGWNGTASLQFKPPASPVGFQVDGMYQQSKAKSTAVTADLDKYEIWSGTGDIVFWFPVAKETKIRPYILGGGGVYNIKQKFLTAGAPSSSFTKFGINAGAGFDFDLQSKVGIFLEGRFHNVFVTGSDEKFIPISAGVRIKA